MKSKNLIALTALASMMLTGCNSAPTDTSNSTQPAPATKNAGPAVDDPSKANAAKHAQPK